VKIFDLLDPELAARTLAAMPHDYKVQIVDALGEAKLTPVIDRMPDSAVADIIDHLPAHREAKILAGLDAGHAGNIQELLRHDPHTAGGRMTRNFVTVGEDTTARQVIEKIQGTVDPHTVDFIYVVDGQGRLKGISSLARLMLHRPDERIGAFMRREFSFVGPQTDQEEVARLAQKYRIRAVPVVDPDMKLLGVVSLQDIVDVIQHEASEDMMKMAGATMVDSLHTPTLKRFRMRLPWLFLTLGGELFIALVISKLFRETLERAAILAAFMPAIMATGGNVGLQSTTLIIRGLGMGTIRPSMMMRVLFSELRLGVLLGTACGLGAASMAMILERSHGQVLKLGAAIFAAMISATCATSIVGALEPLVLHRMKLDPATACGPFVTMFNDLFGTTIYFMIAMALGFSSA
jgi:magnesium transporter